MLFRTASAVYMTDDVSENARRAVRDICDAFAGFETGLVMYFCAADYDYDVFAAEIQNAFPGIITFGCSSCGEGINERISRRSVVAMAFAPGTFEYAESAVVIADRREGESENQPDVFTDVVEAIRYVARNSGQEVRDLDYREYVGFILADQINDFNEKMVEQFGDMSNVMLVGGFAGDDMKFDGSSRVMYRGKVYGPNAAVLALWKPTNGFDLLKTEAVEILNDKTVLVTKADEERYIVWELDGKKADEVYARMIGVPLEDMNIIAYGEHPWAAMVDGEPFMRGVMERVGNGGLRFFSRVCQGTRLTLTKTTDIFQTTTKAMEEKRKDIKSLSAIVHINCASRQNVVEKTGNLDEYAALFGDVPTITISSYGEIYIGTITMTSCILFFK